MKRDIYRALLSTIVALIAVTTASYGQYSNQVIKDSYPNKEIVRVISYNIWCGFEFGKDTTRMRLNAEWIKSKDPDIIALQELCTFDKAKLEEFAAMYGHKYVAILKEEGYPVGVTSKRPIEEIYRQVEGMGHGYMHVRTYGIDIIATHLSPFYWGKRLEEVNTIIEYMDRVKPERALLLGDLNAHSPFDAEELEQHTHFLARSMAYAQQYPDNASVRGTDIDYSVIGRLLSYPMEDVIKRYVPVKERMTYPAFASSKMLDGKPYLLQRGERIDYIFTTLALYKECINAYVWNGDDTNILSDHFPIGIELMIDKQQ